MVPWASTSTRTNKKNQINHLTPSQKYPDFRGDHPIFLLIDKYPSSNYNTNMNDEKKKETGEDIRSLHDEVFKNFFSEKGTAKSFFQEYLPPEITKNLDFGSLKTSKDTFVDKNLSTISPISCITSA